MRHLPCNKAKLFLVVYLYKFSLWLFTTVKVTSIKNERIPILCVQANIFNNLTNRFGNIISYYRKFQLRTLYANVIITLI